MSKVAIVFWSGTGNTAAMADKVKEGAAAAGAEVDVFSSPADFTADMVDSYDAIAMGSPSMGVEVIEEEEVQPMFDAVSPKLSGKKVGLFGSYGWGDGEWMRNWQADCEAAGAAMVMDGVIANDYPDDEACDNCIALGKALA